MEFIESEVVEFKEIVVDDIKKEIIAFANSNGGKLYIGVSDDGSIVGVDNTDNATLQISNMVRDNIKPDITMFIHYETINIDNKNIILVNVQRGTNRPYYLVKKGMRPEGVYVRQGVSSVPASDAFIRQMIKETDGDSYEQMRSLNQKLTFDSLKKEFSLRKIDFGLAQMKTLKIIDNDNLYTNLGLLLSEQCLHTVKVAVFQGTNQNVFKDRREFSGSLLRQMNDVYEYIDIHNNTKATIEKLLRIDTKDYPDIAVRESLLNLLIHRDYSYSASSLISIYDDRIEFVSIGGLIGDISLEDIMIGISFCRNQNLANIFYRLKLIEAYGTGIRKIFDAYKDTNKQPKIEVTRNAFKLTLPNLNVNSDIQANIEKEKKSNKVINNEKKVIEYASNHKNINKNDIVSFLNVSPSTATRLIARLVKGNILKQHGNAKNTTYTLVNQ